ncbi:helix-turn-helix domain-containing protein [Bacillus canaveralius]|uniref:Helix-turn-helix domain-containing protein n=1 Tax=Bacillus canaveralius TaxID=1403243 RepID=A0A2N5GP67_9BACI|nr:RodZ domain-containing protein [Bacillus canaveralius]PLR84297.1 helix-turn-helix domain-containing protein [Bacillus canaveralius]PLR89472.1 helix-turn-helix domain-containing protein [Bacillus canaveralius]
MTELGNRLKEAREAKGMSLDELQTATKIQKRYLKGIEEGNYEMMPGQFYVRAFIRQYAEAVGIEPEELYEQYKNDIPAAHNEDITEKISRVQTRKNISDNSSKILDLLPKILIGIFVIGAIVLIWYLVLENKDQGADEPVNEEDTTINYEQPDSVDKESEKNKDNEKNENTEDKQKEEDSDKADDSASNGEGQVEEAPAQQISVVEASGRNTTYQLTNAKTFNLRVAATGANTWVNITNGKGHSFYQGTLSPTGTNSQTVDLSQETEAVIVIGNSANTEIFVNDQKVEFAVLPSESVRQDITIRKVPANE